VATTSLQKGDIVDKKGFIYVLRAENGLYKIGYTKDVQKRMQTFPRLPIKVELVYTMASENARKLETYILRYFRKQRINGEWFELSDEQFEELKSINDSFLVSSSDKKNRGAQKPGAALGFYFRLSKPEANKIRADLNAIAGDLGYTAVRGPTTGQGNAAELMTCIASGELALVLLPDEQRAWTVEWLYQQAEVLEEANPQIREIGIIEALRTIADALTAAMERESRSNSD